MKGRLDCTYNDDPSPSSLNIDKETKHSFNQWEDIIDFEPNEERTIMNST